MRVLRALVIAWLAAFLAPGVCVAQAGKSLVSTRLEVAGLVRRTLDLSAGDLRTLAQRRGQVSVAGYGGIRLTDVLEEADIRQDERQALRRTYVVAVATDGYQAVFSWGELFNTPVGPGVVVAFERDAQPLRDGEGQIALVSTADNRIGVRHVKWLAKIEVRRIPE